MRRILMVALLVGAGASTAAAQQQTQQQQQREPQAEQKPLHRMKRHEQDLEKKIKTERDRPDKKGRAKEVDKHVEDNIRQLGREIEGVVNESGVPKGEPARASKGDAAKTDSARKAAPADQRAAGNAATPPQTTTAPAR